MKFGYRLPSLRKRIAARTSWKRVVRHNLGLKAPRGWGWVTNPRKAAYNRVYNRTTFGSGSGSGPRAGNRASATMSSASDTALGCGCLIGLAVLAVAIASGPVGWVTAGSFGVIVIVIATMHGKRNRAAAEAAHKADLEAAKAALETAQAALSARREALSSRFGPEAAEAILAQRLWQGATAEMVVESLGQPLDIKERVLKSKTKHTYCYRQTAKNRYALKVHLENGLVVGWDET